eukprot:scaffold91404_cov36-Prasinocladus_malaysianus.AAC.2
MSSTLHIVLPLRTVSAFSVFSSFEFITTRAQPQHSSTLQLLRRLGETVKRTSLRAKNTCESRILKHV